MTPNKSAIPAQGKSSVVGSNTAGGRVCGTPELLEMILLQLPMKDVLLAQCVTRQFKRVTTGSGALQQKLFFKAIPGLSPDTPISLNSMLTKAAIYPRIPVHFDNAGDEGIYWQGISAERDEPTQTWRVVLKLTEKDTCSGDMRYVPRLTSGSWRQMRLSQIPCSLEWELTVLRNSGLRVQGGTIGDTDTVQTMDDMLQALAVSEPQWERFPQGQGGKLPRRALGLQLYKAPAPQDFENSWD